MSSVSSGLDLYGTEVSYCWIGGSCVPMHPSRTDDVIVGSASNRFSCLLPKFDAWQVDLSTLVSGSLGVLNLDGLCHLSLCDYYF